MNPVSSKPKKTLLQNPIFIVFLILGIFGIFISAIIAHYICCDKMLHAIYKNNMRLVRTLAFVDPWSVDATNSDIMEMIKEPGLIAAIKYKHKNIAVFIIKRGADVNSSDYSKKMPLHHAVQVGDVDIVKLLLQKGANARAVDNIKDTPLHLTVESKDITIAKILLSYNANPNATDNLGGTPLHYAVNQKNSAMTKLLLDSKADPNKKDNEGDTPLRNAVFYGRKHNAALLRQYGNKQVIPRIFEAAAFGDVNVVRVSAKVKGSHFGDF